MAIIDVVKYQFKEGEVVHRFLSEGLRWGTQVVVYPGQLAYFAKGGQICDEFKEGTYTLSTKNIPVLNHLVNLPFGGDSPFQADVWFVNLLSKLDYRWGTETPIQIEDPKYGIIVPVRAYGQYGFRIADLLPCHRRTAEGTLLCRQHPGLPRQGTGFRRHALLEERHEAVAARRELCEFSDGMCPPPIPNV